MLKRGVLLTFILVFPARAIIDNYHFYQANRFWGEPRFERPWLTTFDVYVGGGHATLSRNSCGDKTPLFNIYGPSDLQHVAQGVPLNPNDPIDRLLIQLNDLPNNDGFGKVLFGGDISLNQAIFTLWQNFKHGFFMGVYVPIRAWKIYPGIPHDLSPATGYPNSQNPLWRTLLVNLNPILAKFDLTLAPSTKTWFGDFSCWAGWTKNYQETEVLDYIDFTLEAGLLIPSCKAVDPRKIFDVSTGYNHHWGGGITGYASFGVWEWLTLGGSTGALFLADRTARAHIKTGSEQQGLIALAQGNVNRKQGAYWHVSTYVKTDHLSEIFSFILGYSYLRKNQDRAFLVSPIGVGDNCAVIPPGCPIDNQGSFVGTELSFKSWDRHTIHVQFEFDFAKEARIWHPHIYFSYDHPVAGHRIFQLSMGGATFGIDLTW